MERVIEERWRTLAVLDLARDTGASPAVEQALKQAWQALWRASEALAQQRRAGDGEEGSGDELVDAEQPEPGRAA